MSVWTCLAPAKVNLYLHVGPPRADGRHPLDSLVVFADIGDQVWCDGDGNGVAFTGPYASALARALAGPIPMVTAAQALAQAHGRAFPGGWRLDKQLPIAAGLGGGTADTAAAIRLAQAALDLGLDAAALAQFAAGYGGDAPACIACAPVLMRDDGARLEAPSPLPDLHAVLVNPNQPCSTAAVYRRFDEMGLGHGFAETAPPAGPDLISALAAYRNDLEAPALQVQPAIATVLAALRAAPETRLARMSGSGATCFALTDSAAAAAALAERINRSHPNWWSRPARLGAVDATPKRM